MMRVPIFIMALGLQKLARENRIVPRPELITIKVPNATPELIASYCLDDEHALFLVPSGLCMAPYAESGWVAAASLSSLAVATTVCIVLGWKSAVKRRWASHRRWMWR